MKDTEPDSSPALSTCHSVDGPLVPKPRSQARSFADVVCGFVDASNSIAGLASFLFYKCYYWVWISYIFEFFKNFYSFLFKSNK